MFLSLIVVARGTLKFLFCLKIDSQLSRGGKSSYNLWSELQVMESKSLVVINMLEARYETPGKRIPVLGGYRSSKRLADLWRGYLLSSVV